MIRSIILAAIVASSISIAPFVPANAHGKPEHGGAFCEVREYTFEVVAKREGEETKFTAYVKDPALKPVKEGKLDLKVWENAKKSQTVSLTGNGEGEFTATAKVPNRGRYKVGVKFELTGKKPMSCNVSVKES